MGNAQVMSGMSPQGSPAAQQPIQSAAATPTGAVHAVQTPADDVLMTGAQKMQKKYNNDPLWAPAAAEAPRARRTLVFMNPDTQEEICLPGLHDTEPAPEMHHGRSFTGRSAYGSPRPARSFTQEQKLAEDVVTVSENAWKPSMRKDKPVHEDENVLLEVRALLNKLTPSNYDKLMHKMIEGDIPFHDTPERLRATVGLIFDKVSEEPDYADYTEVYAKMCRDLVKTEANNTNGEVVKFRTVLLSRTQRYFEKACAEEEEAEQDKNEKDREPVQKNRAKGKRHYLGVIRFISELYKVEMLTDRVILSCFQKLLPKKANFEDADEEKLECLCLLLQTCAKMIREQMTVNIIYQQLQNMIEAGVCSSRIRFMMEDTIDLKKNSYLPRKIAKARPTTIEEVHAAYRNENQQVRQAGAVQLPRKKPKRGALAGRRGGRMLQTGRNTSLDVPTLGPQRAQWGSASGGIDVHLKSASSARPPEDKSVSSSRESSMNRLTNPRRALTHTRTFPDDERVDTPLASAIASSQVVGARCYLPVQEDVETDRDDVDEQAGNMRTRALSSEDDNSRIAVAPVEVEGLLNIRDLINELTLQNCRNTADSIVLQWAPLLRRSESWSAIAALILAKAVEQSPLDRPYLCCAELCRELICSVFEDASKKSIDFRGLLVHQTKEYFEEVTNEKVVMEEAEGYCDDSEELQRKKIRITRHHSNAVSFISELHKAGVLTNNDHLGDLARSVADNSVRSKTKEYLELHEEQEVRQGVADRGPVQLPRHVQMSQRGGMAGHGGMMPESGMSKPSSVSRHGGRPAIPPTEIGKKKLMGLLSDHALGPQLAQWGSGSGMGMHPKNASAARPLGNESASSNRESSMNRLNNPRGSLMHTLTFPDEERSGTAFASKTATPIQVAGTPSRSPVQEDVELDAEAVDEQTGVMMQRAVNSEGDDSRDVISESVRTVRRWTGPTKALFIRSILDRSCDAKSRERARYPEFLMALAREGLFSQDVLADGLGLIVEDTSDIAVDVPQMYDYVVDLMGPLVLDGLLGAAALDGALNTSPDHLSEYYGAFRKWLEFHLSPQQKEELMTRGPVLWHKILWTEKRSRHG